MQTDRMSVENIAKMTQELVENRDIKSLVKSSAQLDTTEQKSEGLLILYNQQERVKVTHALFSQSSTSEKYLFTHLLLPVIVVWVLY